MYRDRTVAVVIPAHNEARLLPITLAGLPDFIDHIIVVDDASTDATAEVALNHPRSEIELVRHPENLGVGGAIVTGYRRALALEAALTVVVGADAQMDPREMSSLLDPLVEGDADYVKGDRMGHPQLKQVMPSVRLFGNRVLTVLTRYATGYRDVRDSQCGYTAIANPSLRRLPLADLYPRYGFPNDLLAKLAEQDQRVVDRPVSPIYDTEISGIRVHRVAFPILWLLVRSGLRRWFRQRAFRRQVQVNCDPALAVQIESERPTFTSSVRSTS